MGAGNGFGNQGCALRWAKGACWGERLKACQRCEAQKVRSPPPLDHRRPTQRMVAGANRACMPKTVRAEGRRSSSEGQPW